MVHQLFLDPFSHDNFMRPTFDVSQTRTIEPLILKRSFLNPTDATNANTKRVFEIEPMLIQRSRLPINKPSNLRSKSNFSKTPKTENSSSEVKFCPNVTVKPIPSRFDYAEDVRQRLWSSLQEIKENARRNEAEFLFDGCRWQHATEENTMHYDREKGDWVHPVHIEKVYMLTDDGAWKPVKVEEDTISADNIQFEKNRVISNFPELARRESLKDRNFQHTKMRMNSRKLYVV